MQLNNPITLQLILSKNDVSKDQNIEEALLNIRRIWLDNSRVSDIDNLEILGNITHLYLNNNNITVIQNLETVGTTLQHLNLRGNQIADLGEGLICLDRLVSLDLSNNKIEAISYRSLPTNISFLNILENPVVDNFDEDDLIEGLLNLKMLNDEMLYDDDDADDQLDDVQVGDVDANDVQVTDFSVQDITNQFLHNSIARQIQLLEEHEVRMGTLNEIKHHMEERSETLNTLEYTPEPPDLINSTPVSGKLLPPLERTISSHIIPKKPSQLEPLPQSAKRTKSGKPLPKPPRINSPKRIIQQTAIPDISLRQPLDTSLVNVEGFDEYLVDVRKMFSDLRSSCQKL